MVFWLDLFITGGRQVWQEWGQGPRLLQTEAARRSGEGEFWFTKHGCDKWETKRRSIDHFIPMNHLYCPVGFFDDRSVLLLWWPGPRGVTIMCYWAVIIILISAHMRHFSILMSPPMITGDGVTSTLTMETPGTGATRCCQEQRRRRARSCNTS